MSVQSVIDVARGELNVTEYPPGSNRVKYWEDYDPKMQGQPWCVAFLWWAFTHAGEGRAFFAGAKTASCGTLFRWYQAQGLTVPVPEVKAGDIVLMNFHGGSAPEHCGLAVEVGLKNGVYTVNTVEGNTSPGFEGSQDNGGCVAEKARYIRQIVGVCRPQYTEEVEPVDDIKGHWAEKEIRRCIQRGIIKGYPDGMFAPDHPITRAEVAVVVDRLVQLLVEEGNAG